MSYLKINALRMARYSKTPVGFFLSLDMDEFADWKSVIESEAKAEKKAIDETMKRQKK